MDWNNNLYIYVSLMACPNDFLLCKYEVDICGFELNNSTTIEWIFMRCGTPVPVSFRMNFYDPLTFPLAPSSSQSFYLFGDYDQVFTRLITFPSACLCCVVLTGEC